MLGLDVADVKEMVIAPKKSGERYRLVRASKAAQQIPNALNSKP
jgi:hypothetical protein